MKKCFNSFKKNEVLFWRRAVILLCIVALILALIATIDASYSDLVMDIWTFVLVPVGFIIYIGETRAIRKLKCLSCESESECCSDDGDSIGKSKK